MTRDRMDGSFRQNNRFVVAFAPQSLENILPEMAIRIDCSLRSIYRIGMGQLAQPFFVSVRRRFAERTVSRRVDKGETGEPGQRLQRFPGIKADRRVRIGHAVNEIGIKPVVARNFFALFPAIPQAMSARWPASPFKIHCTAAAMVWSACESSGTGWLYHACSFCAVHARVCQR